MTLLSAPLVLAQAGEEGSERKTTEFDRRAESALRAPTTVDAFDVEIWNVLNDYIEGENEFEERRLLRENQKAKKELLQKWVLVEDVEVEVSEYDFKRKRFRLSVSSLPETARPRIHWSFQPVSSQRGDSAAVFMWMSRNKKRLKAPELHLRMKSDEEAEQWKNEHGAGGFTASFVCRLGPLWKVGHTAYGLEGISLRSCIVRFLSPVGVPIGEVKL